MGFEQARTDLRTHFHNNWSQTPIQWPNASFDSPDPPAPFVKFNTQPGNSNKLEVGKSGMSNYPGVLFLGINVPTGSGDGQPAIFFDDLRTMFEFKTIGIVRVKEFQPTTVGQSDDGVWYQENANFGFEWRERPQ